MLSHFTCTLLLAFASLPTRPVLPPIRNSAPPPASVGQVSFAAQVRSDLNRRIPGEVVVLHVVGQPEIQLTTDVIGQTAPVDIAAGTQATIRLTETMTSGGSTLGQLLPLSMPVPAPGIDYLSYLRVFFQPILVPVHVTTDKPRISPAPDHDRWALQPVQGASKLSFQAQIGMLLTRNEIDALAAYHGIQLHPPAFQPRLGIVVRSPGVELGSYNLVLEVDCAGHGFEDPPVTAICILRDATLGPVSSAPTLRAVRFDWAEERVYLALSGRLERGDNVILLGPSNAPAESVRLLVDRPQSSPAISLPVSNCEPVCATPAPRTCPPRALASDTGCTPAQRLGGGCAQTNDRIPASSLCGDPGLSKGFVVKLELGVAVSLKITFNVLGTPVEVSATGHVNVSTEQSGTITFQPGAHGCGQCWGFCLEVLQCVDRYLVQRHAYLSVVDDLPSMRRQVIPCARTDELDTHCEEWQGPHGESCSRTCN